MNALGPVRDLPRRLNAAVDGWLTAPETNAAGRMGLFRIVYGLFYLWVLGRTNYDVIGQTAGATWRPIGIDSFMQAAPSVALLQALQFLMVAALILLIGGYRVRLVTLVVLVTGIALEAFRYSFGKVDHATLFLNFYIPLFMLLSRWGATYSLDAALESRRIGRRVDASDASWRFIWPMRVVLIVLGALFLTAAYWKTIHGTWESNPDTLRNLLLLGASGAMADGSTMSPIVALLLRVPPLTTLMQAGTMAFESLFFLSLFNRPLRNWFLAIAVVFHGANLILLNVNFSPQLIVYMLFIDWQALYVRWISPHIPHLRFGRLPAGAWVAGALTAALVVGTLWIYLPAIRVVPSLGGLLNGRSAWVIVLPIAVVACFYNSLVLVRSLRPRHTRAGRPLPNA